MVAEVTAAAAAAVTAAGDPGCAELAVTGNPPPARGCTPPALSFVDQGDCEASAERGELADNVALSAALWGDDGDDWAGGGAAPTVTEETGAEGSNAIAAMAADGEFGIGAAADNEFAVETPPVFSAKAAARAATREGDDGPGEEAPLGDCGEVALVGTAALGEGVLAGDAVLAGEKAFLTRDGTPNWEPVFTEETAGEPAFGKDVDLAAAAARAEARVVVGRPKRVAAGVGDDATAGGALAVGVGLVGVATCDFPVLASVRAPLILAAIAVGFKEDASLARSASPGLRPPRSVASAFALADVSNHAIRSMAPACENR